MWRQGRGAPTQEAAQRVSPWKGGRRRVFQIGCVGGVGRLGADRLPCAAVWRDAAADRRQAGPSRGGNGAARGWRGRISRGGAFEYPETEDHDVGFEKMAGVSGWLRAARVVRARTKKRGAMALMLCEAERESESESVCEKERGADIPTGIEGEQERVCVCERERQTYRQE